MPDFVLDSLAKATLLLGVAGLATLLWRRTAAPRHFVWTLALAGTLVLPAARLLGPVWQVPVLPPLAVETFTPTPPAVPTAARGPVAAALPPSPGTTITSSQSDPEPGEPGLGWWLALVWASGLMLVFGLYGVGAMRVAQLARRARPLRSSDWRGLQASLAAGLRLRTPVRLLVASGPAMPMTWGTRRPVILLPADAEQWPESRRRDVLLHELAHVARRDCLTQLVALCACAVYWFHPLVWVAARRLRIERERACDDRVLAAGATPSAYAEHLLEIARTLRAGTMTGLASVAMARPSQLSNRLLDVLDPARRRDAVTRRFALRAAAIAALLVPPLAVVHPTRIAARRAESPATLATRSLTIQAPRHAVRNPAVRTSVVEWAADTGDCAAAVPRGASSRSSSNTSDDGARRTRLQYKTSRCTLELVAEGAFRFTADFTDLSAIDAGGSVVVTRVEGGESRRVEMRPGTEGVSHRWFVGDAERPYDAAARAWLAETLTQLLRRTGYAADARSRWILQTRGQDALIQEIALVSGDYAKRVYYQALIADGPLDGATVARVVTQAGSEISSDYDLAEVLVLVASRYPLNEPTRTAFVGAADHIQSDYDRRRVLKVVLAGKDLPDDLAAAVLTAAGGIQSDYDLAEVLVQLTSKHPITPAMSAAFFRAVDGIESDYDRRRVLATVLAQRDMPAALVAGALTAAGGISSDFDRAEVLVQVAEGPGLDDASRPAFFAAADGIGSDHDHARVLTALSERPGMSDAVAAAVIASARRIGSDYDRANVLVAVARYVRLRGAVREAYVAAANSIGSETDRNRALAALAGSSELD
ncbi:MAG TPA: M56 family metallopeptidase [Gemmatimonadales bacterium]|nr:M56 family metallopeptidase [Gemmatimonadales bacterium]